MQFSLCRGNTLYRCVFPPGCPESKNRQELLTLHQHQQILASLNPGEEIARSLWQHHLHYTSCSNLIWILIAELKPQMSFPSDLTLIYTAILRSLWANHLKVFGRCIKLSILDYNFLSLSADDRCSCYWTAGRRVLSGTTDTHTENEWHFTKEMGSLNIVSTTFIFHGHLIFWWKGGSLKLAWSVF